MYNQSALIRIAKQLFPEKNVFQLTKLEQRIKFYQKTNKL